MMEAFRHPPARTELRAGLFVLLLLIINVVMDGPPKVASELSLQIALLPFCGIFVLGTAALGSPERFVRFAALRTCLRWLAMPAVLRWLAVFFEGLFLLVYAYQAKHFRWLGYEALSVGARITFAVSLISLSAIAVLPRIFSDAAKLLIYLASYSAGQILCIFSFPLSYLRSDMLPVISWADRALVAGRNPYQHFYVADRVYDFPYLPGALLAFAPAEAVHVDLRWTCIVYVLATATLLYKTVSPGYRKHASLLVGIVLLCPYMQYRHELYTQPLFFSLVLIFALLRRRLFVLSGAAFGLSIAISQFSWVIFPFFLLYSLRRSGWKEVGRMMLIAAAVAGILFAPFLLSGAGNIAHNAVGQWDRLQRPIARPINLSYWATYIVRPVNLKWVQLTILSAIFVFCWMKRRCSDVSDTLFWMVVALLVFVLFNVLVDGYFYLMLLIPMVSYICAANGWWSDDRGMQSE